MVQKHLIIRPKEFKNSPKRKATGIDREVDDSGGATGADDHAHEPERVDGAATSSSSDVVRAVGTSTSAQRTVRRRTSYRPAKAKASEAIATLYETYPEVVPEGRNVEAGGDSVDDVSSVRDVASPRVENKPGSPSRSPTRSVTKRSRAVEKRAAQPDDGKSQKRQTTFTIHVECDDTDITSEDGDDNITIELVIPKRLLRNSKPKEKESGPTHLHRNVDANTHHTQVLAGVITPQSGRPRASSLRKTASASTEGSPTSTAHTIHVKAKKHVRWSPSVGLPTE